LGHLSVLEYELQFKKAKTVIDQLLMLRKKKKHNHEDATLYAPNLNDGVISHSDVIATTEKILKREGVNFHKDDYEAFAAYLNYDANGNIAVDRLNYFVFDESEEEARERFERRARREVPNTQKETKEEK
jgi:DNA polymerase III delta prime subunit